MTIQLTAFRWVPPFAQGYVRDLRIRWALEEAGLPYEVVLIDPNTQKSEGYRQWQPFGQVPAYRDGDVEMFESGAVVLHIAEKSEKLCPRDPAGRARVTTWVLAALNSIEPHAQTLLNLDAFFSGQDWIEGRRPSARAMVDSRLAGLSAWLGDKDYLEGTFTAGDLVMACVLRELDGDGYLDGFANVKTYVDRCLARPAFVKSLEDQMNTFRQFAPA